MKEVRKSGFLWKITFLIIILALSVKIGKAQNVKPVADAGSSRYAGPEPIVLDGTGSYDPDNSGTLSYTWRQTAGPSVIIVDDNSATPTIGGTLIATGRGGIPKLGGFPQTEVIQNCEFELVVSDGELTSLPDFVKVIIVPDFGTSRLQQENPPFDPNKPTIIYFGGGNCYFGGSGQGYLIEWSIWYDRANVISFPHGYEQDTTSSESWHTYYRYGDMIIAYLSKVAPDYTQLIQTIGFSTGGQAALDVGIHLNRIYQDRRYAVNHVTELDAPCRWHFQGISIYESSNELYQTSAVDGEQCWHDHYWGDAYLRDEMNQGVPLDLLCVYLGGYSHEGVVEWYKNSLEDNHAHEFNEGVVAGAYWSVVGPGKNLQLTQENVGHYFSWLDDIESMKHFDSVTYPGRLPKPVTLVGPEDGAIVDVNGTLLSCEESENAVGYQLLFGSDPYRVMDYNIVSDTPSPPTEIIMSFPYEHTWWTVRAYDAFGSTIYADPLYINVAFPAYAKYNGGTGEPNDPYQIATAEDLMLLRESVEDYDKHFIMIDDIDLDPNLPGRKVFDRAVIAPDWEIPFTGVFNGNGHIVSNLIIEGDGYLGLFGRLESEAKISNLGVEAVDVNGISGYIGGLAGESGNLNSRGGIITNCYSTGIVHGEHSIGGLVGFSYEGVITQSYCRGSVSGEGYVGGLVGYSEGIIATSYSEGTTSGDTKVGGLVGENHGSITDSYSTCTVNGENAIGGLAGRNSFVGPSIVTNCYSAGKVTGNISVSGLVGDGSRSTDVTNCFWDKEIVGFISGVSGKPVTTAEMQTARTFLRAGWDFMDETENGTEDIWWIDEGQDYPRLWWEQSTDDMLFLVVDDFESYNDLDEEQPDSNRIWNTWIDGLDNPNNGSMVGESMPPFVYFMLAHTGEQSMPYYYDNSGPANYSEATANVANLMAGQDWTKHDIKTLSLWFRRFLESDPWFHSPENDPEPMYVSLANANGPTTAVYHDDPNAAQITAWTEWRIDLQEFASQGVDLTNINTISIGFGYKNNPHPGGSGKMYFDDIRLYRPAP